MKKFLSGILTGTILTGTIAFAATYTAEDARFKVFVEGQEFTNGKAVVINGSTYLPLKAVGQALGVEVNWNDEQHQVEVGNQSPVAQNNDYSRTNPAPINTVQTYTRTNKYDFIDLSSITPDYSAAVRISDVIRGEKAWEKIKKDNMFNEDAKDGYEYIIAKVHFSLLTAQNDVSINVNSYNFDFYSGNNEKYDYQFVSIEGGLSTDIFVGGTAEGYIVGMVKKDDANPKVAYGLDYNGQNGIWFALK